MKTILLGRIHRYNNRAKTKRPTERAEQALSQLFNGRYTHLVTSGGTALQIALKAIGVGPGEYIATNVYTLSPVAGAIASTGAKPTYINTTTELIPNIEHLDQLLRGSQIRALLLSHMRGRIPNLVEIQELCTQFSVPIIEDCAHSLGSYHKDKLVGTFSDIAVFSLQENKPISTGEGGFLVTHNHKLYERIVELSGSYSFDSTFSRRTKEKNARVNQPNLSMRIDEIRASLIPDQIKILKKRRIKSQKLYAAFKQELTRADVFEPIDYPATKDTIRLSIQFKKTSLNPLTAAEIEMLFVEEKIPITWIGRLNPTGYHSTPWQWGFLGEQLKTNRTSIHHLKRISSNYFDSPIPLHFSVKDIVFYARRINTLVLKAIGKRH
jgi:dTDP-4-amino-4,6-dideoxygalactose transaminase